MKAEIISTGTEILLGNIIDANTAFLAEHLAQLGIDLHYATNVGDNFERMLGILKTAWGRSDLILMTGGLGPTQGDITREVIADMFEEKMEIDPGLKANLEQQFKKYGIDMSANNLKQACLIPSAQAIPNPRGTAPGWWAEKNGKIVVAMPGPPGEMQPMWHNHVAPGLQSHAEAVILSKVLKVFGIPEGTLDEKLSTFINSANPTLALYAKPDGINMRITAKAAAKAEAQAMIEKYETEIRKLVGESIWGADDDTLEGVVGQKLIKRGLTLAVAESYTGGALMQILAHAPDSARFFRGGLLAASDEAKLSLGLVWGAGGTAEIAKGMAALAKEKTGASIGLGIEAQAQKVEADTITKVFVAYAMPNPRQTTVRSYAGRLAQVTSRVANQALFELMKVLEQPP